MSRSVPSLELTSLLNVQTLASFGDRIALYDGERSISYEQLARMVSDRSLESGERRQVVQIEGVPDVDFVVAFLAALEAGHPVLMSDGGPSSSALADTFRVGDADVELHPDLALLMSTSGSTGAGKLVRLSAAAVSSNAHAIAQYLELTPDDCGITALPVHYCYGLSVLTSHLVVGASIVLTDASVIDPCFWAAVERHGVTGFGGVPHSFEMIERVGSDVLAAPSLRYITQAGGRLRPVDALRLHDLGVERGWELFVMYGQTEATARIAYLDPKDLPEHPRSVGRAIPGGSLSIDTSIDSPLGSDVGEVVYRGPNVMMGYATEVADLALGGELDELRTGDLGRFDADGRLEIVGRASRFVKIHGKRIDLDHLESRLAARGWSAVCSGDDDGLVVVTEDASPDVGERLAIDAVELSGVPRKRVVATSLAQIPRTTSGKVDHPALVNCARGGSASAPSAEQGESVSAAFAVVFGRTDIDVDDTFASLGGDSFSYVEMSTRLEQSIGELPLGWHLMSVRDLSAIRPARGRRRWTTQLDTSVVVRAIAILLIVCTHMKLFRLAGGAHALLAVLGWNFARFQLLPHEVPHRLKRAASTIGRVAIPTSAWIGINMVIAGGYSIGAMLLVNNYTGSGHREGGRWEYWYFEAFVQIMVVLALVFSVGAVRRLERRGPFLFALGVLALTWLFRFEIVNLGGAYNEIFRPHTAAVFVAIGWCAQRARGVGQRMLVTALAAVSTFGYFATVGYVNQFDRELRILLLVAAMIWLPTVRLPTPLAVVVSKIAAASMFIFLIHWQVWPLLTPLMADRVAFWLTIAAGVAVWAIAERIGSIWSQRRRDGVRNTKSQVSSADTAIKTSDVTPVSA